MAMTICRQFSVLSLWFPLASGQPDGNCGVSIPRVPGAPDKRLEELTLGDPDSMDLEDLLFSENEDDWQHIHYNCAHGESSSCRTFGVEHWNLTSFWYNVITSPQGEPDPEDVAVVPESCGGRIACRRIKGRLRIVTMHLTEDEHHLTWKLQKLPHLFAVALDGATKKAIRGLSSLKLQLLRLEYPEASALKALRQPLLGSLRSLQIHGRQDQLRWTAIDLRAVCGADLMYFHAFAINVVGGTLPDCWRTMRNLRTFYCSTCMMHLPPTALRGLTSLTSFVAFRQWEMIPCALQHVNSSNCKVSWETLHGTKGHDVEEAMRDSTGEWSDFQEGPSFICPAASYRFAFEEFVKLGWSNIRKVWLDGNFLTGTIPANIKEAWPKLESLDLYDNSMEGPIPEALGQLPFVKFQLQGNRFSGKVPKAVMDLTKRPDIILGLQENPELEGCAPDVGHWKNGIPGTRIRRCDGEL